MDVDPILAGVAIPMVRRGARRIAVHVDCRPARGRMRTPICGGASQGYLEVGPQSRLIHRLTSRLVSVYDPQGLVAAVGLSGEEIDRFEGYRLLWAIFWLTMLLPGNSAFARNPPGTTEAQAAHVHEILMHHT